MPLASAGDEDDIIARAFSGSGKPVLSRVDPYGDLVLSPAEMGRFIAEAGSLAGGVDETGAGRVRRVLELARRCGGTPREQNSTCREIRRRPRYSEPCGGHGCHGLATKARAEAGGTAVGCRPRKAVPGAARLTGNLERRPQRLD